MDETVYWHSKGWDINEQGNKTHSAVVQYVEEKKRKRERGHRTVEKKQIDKSRNGTKIALLLYL